MRFFYLRDSHNHPIGCLATELHKAQPNGTIKVDMVQYALSICNPLDQFKREQARSLAAGRLATAMPKRYIPITSDDAGQVKLRILSAIANGPFPQRARMAAAHWLITHAPSQAATIANAAVQAGDPKLTESPIVAYANHMKNINLPRPCPICGGIGKHTNVCATIRKPKSDSDAHLGAVEPLTADLGGS